MFSMIKFQNMKNNKKIKILNSNFLTNTTNRIIKISIKADVGKFLKSTAEWNSIFYVLKVFALSKMSIIH